ncbi:unnamed protein product, partial [Oppiella nova]
MSKTDGYSNEVPRGNIFALLGPNGTGKTTLIRTILGRLRYKSGSIRVFGVKSGSDYSDIPGPGVGYMPQELALFEEFTIEECLTYYGTIYNLNAEDMQIRIDALMQLLNLPEKTRPVSQLSGGQTVIITTHYIEEARSAAQVAFMNSGTILKQSAPNQLMSEYQCSTLEEVFLRLCQRDIQRRKSRQMSLVQALSTVRIGEILEDVEESPKNGHKLNKKLIEVSRIKAMLWKYYVLALRRPMFLIMYYMIPIVALVTMNWTISQSPYNIPVAIYNADLNPKLSQLYIDSIDKEYLRLTEYPDNASAFESVVK